MFLVQDFTKRIQMYEALIDEIDLLRRDIPLNLINLDCSLLNDTLSETVSELRTMIVDYFINLSRTHNRGLVVFFIYRM